MTETFKRNLLIKLCGSCEYIPSDEDLNKALSILSKRDRYILESRYDSIKKTYKELSNELGLSRSYISVREHNVLRKLRHPNILGLITYILISKKEYKELLNAKLYPKNIYCFTDTPIEYLDLSVRLYNVLKRNSIHTVGDIMNKTFLEFKRFRSMGIKSFAELISIIDKYKIPFKKENNFNDDYSEGGDLNDRY